MASLILNGNDISISANGLHLIVKDNKEITKYLPSTFNYDLIFTTAITGYISLKALYWLSERKNSNSILPYKWE